MKLLLGSNNLHKQRELQQIFDNLLPGKVELLLPDDVLDEKIDVIENGVTLEENAELKALAFHEASGLPCIADDTGLEIDALDGQPGVYSARFAGMHGNDSENRKKVLALMEKIPFDQRTAQFRTVICFIEKKDIHFVDGICRGNITFREQGNNGFGYDSIFQPSGKVKTFAEMSAKQKNKLSHRGKATVNFVKFLKQYFGLEV